MELSDGLKKEIDGLIQENFKEPTWTKERIIVLTYLWEQGVSNQEILRIFKLKYPKTEWKYSTIANKAYRLGLRRIKI